MAAPFGLPFTSAITVLKFLGIVSNKFNHFLKNLSVVCEVSLQVAFKWQQRSASHYELFHNEKHGAHMLIHATGNNRFAKIIQGQEVFLIHSKGFWDSETVLVDEFGLFIAGFRQDRWTKNHYHLMTKYQALEMLWLNEDQQLVVMDNQEVHLCLKVNTDNNTIDFMHQSPIDINICYLSWYFFEPIVSGISPIASLYATSCG